MSADWGWSGMATVNLRPCLEQAFLKSEEGRTGGTTAEHERAYIGKSTGGPTFLRERLHRTVPRSTRLAPGRGDTWGWCLSELRSRSADVKCGGDLEPSCSPSIQRDDNTCLQHTCHKDTEQPRESAAPCADIFWPVNRRVRCLPFWRMTASSRTVIITVKTTATRAELY